MICSKCSTRNECVDICARVESIIHDNSGVCLYDMIYRCGAGDPDNMYHRACDESTCESYSSRTRIKRDFELDNVFMEVNSVNVGEVELGKLQNVGEIVISGGYSRLYIPTINKLVGNISIGNFLRDLLIKNPLDLFTPRQKQALRLYYNIVTTNKHSFVNIASIMGISKKKAVHHVAVGIMKVRLYIMLKIVETLMSNAMILSDIGLDIEIGNFTVKMSNEERAKIRSIMLTKKANDLLSREQFEILWMFCGVDGKAKSLGEISDLVGESRDVIKKKIEHGVNNINKYLIANVLNLSNKRLCQARDCVVSFTPTREDRIYCSRRCNANERIRRCREKKKFREERVCEECGIKFIATKANQWFHNKYCEIEFVKKYGPKAFKEIKSRYVRSNDAEESGRAGTS